jgi:hypothetical protein
MATYLIGVDFQAGDDPTPMTDWTPAGASRAAYALSVRASLTVRVTR